MADIVWPASIGVETAEFWPEWAVSRSESPFTRQQQVMGRPGAVRWRTKITVGRYDKISARAFDAFMTSLKGGLQTILVPDFRRMGPGSPDYRGLQDWINETYATPFGIHFDTGSYWDAAADGDPVFSAGVWTAPVGEPELLSSWTGDGAVTVAGLAPNKLALLAGDLIQVSPGRVAEVAEDAVTDRDGRARVRLQPRLREPVAFGPLLFPARVRMRLDSSAAARNPTRPPVVSSYEIEMTEDLNV